MQDPIAATELRSSWSGILLQPDHDASDADGLVLPIPALPKRRYRDGTTNRLSKVEVISPPRMTIANGCSIS